MSNVLEFKPRTKPQTTVSKHNYSVGNSKTTYEAMFMLRDYYLYIDKDISMFNKISDQIIVNLSKGEAVPIVPLNLLLKYQDLVIPNYLIVKKAAREARKLTNEP